MRKIVLLVAFQLMGMLVMDVFAQYVHTFNKTNSGPFILAPFDNDSSYNWSEIIYTDEVLENITGRITKIAFQPEVGGYSPGSGFPASHQSVYLKTTSNNVFSNANYPDTNSFTRVYRGSVIWDNYKWSEITFDQPFDYTGQNLNLLWFNKDGNAYGKLMTFEGMADFGANVVRKNASDAAFPESSGTLHTFLPNIQITFEDVTDIGIAQWIQPAEVMYPQIAYPFEVVLTNYAPDSIYQALIHWSIDGVEQTTFNWNDTLLYQQHDTIEIGQLNLSEGIHQINVWTDQPNGLADENPANDTMTFSLSCFYEIVSGDYTSTMSSVPLNSRDYGWSSALYTASEIETSGKITHLAYYNEGSNYLAQHQKIYMKHTNQSSFDQKDYEKIDTGYLVFSGDVQWAQDQWTVIALDSAFYYNGSDQLLIQYENRNGTTMNDYYVRCLSTSPDYMAKHGESYAGFPTSGNLNLRKPVIKLRFSPDKAVDMSVFELLAPENGQAYGNYQLKVALANLGSDVLTSADIAYSVNDQLQSEVSWSGNMQFFQQDSLSLNAFNFDEGINDIKIWSKDPNGVADLNPSNDTLSRELILCSGPLSGTYDIPGHFQTLSEATKILSHCGINGPVVLALQPREYNKQITLDNLQIPGLSDENRITIRAATGDSSDVVIRSSDARHTFKLEKTNHVVIENLTFRNDSSGVPFLISACDSVYIRNNRFASDSNLQNLAEITDSCQHICIENNLFDRGDNGLYFNANGQNVRISDNHFKNQKKYAINVDNEIYDLNINRNVIESTKGISVIYSPGFRITRNQIFTNSYFLFIGTCDADLNNPNLIANNFCKSTGSNAYIMIGNARNTLIYYNTIRTVSSYVISIYSDELFIKNNILENTSGFGDIFNINRYTSVMDYNSYYYNNNFYNNKSFADWQNNYGQDQHSDTLKVYFENDGLHTGHIVVSNKGDTVSMVTTDIDGDLRDTLQPDIGADEFNGCTEGMKGSYVIDHGGSGDFRSFHEAKKQMMYCGVDSMVQFFVMPGTYEEQIVLSDSIIRNPSASASKIAFYPANGDSTSVTLTWDAESGDDNYVIKLDNINHVIVHGLTIKPRDSIYMQAIVMEGNVNHNIISGNVIEGHREDDFNLNGALIYSTGSVAGKRDTGNWIVNNLFLNGSFAYYNSDDDAGVSTILQGNRFLDQYARSIYVTNIDSFSVNKNYFTTRATDYSYLFLRVSTCDYFVMNANRFMNSTDFNGITLLNLRYSNHATLSNNMASLLYTYDHGYVFDVNNSSAKIIYNSIRVDSRNDRNVDVVYVRGTEHDVSVWNNVFYNTTEGQFLQTNHDGSNKLFTSDYNCFYGNTGYFSRYNATNQEDFASWKNESGNDQHSFYTDPRFVSDTNLHISHPLLNGSALLISGLDFDIDGETRDPANPDIGADEFTNPVYQLDDQVVACAYDTAWLDAGNYYDSYQWMPGSYNERYYAVIREDAGKDTSWYKSEVGLNSETYEDSIKVVFTKPRAAVREQVDTCAYIDLHLENWYHDTSNTYYWQHFMSGESDWTEAIYANPRYDSVEITKQIYPESAYIRVIVTDIYGCISMDSTKINAYEKPSRPDIRWGGVDSLKVTTPGTYYQWFRDQMLLEDSVDMILPNGSGNYRAVVFNHACASDTSEAFQISNIQQLVYTDSLHVYPNPASEYVYIESENNKTAKEISVMNSQGKLLARESFNTNKFAIDVRELMPGHYFILLKEGTVLKAARIIVVSEK